MSLKCVARTPERWQPMLNILPESFADFKQKSKDKKMKPCFSDVKDMKHFCMHTDKQAPNDTHTENMA